MERQVADIPEDVAPEAVVAGEGHQSAPADRQGEEYLSGSVPPHL